MNSHFLQEGIVLLPFETLRCILLVLGSDIARHAGHSARLLLGAFEDDLNSIAFRFLCHNYTRLNEANISLFLGFAKCGSEAILLDNSNTLAGNLKGDEPLLFLGPETLVLEVDREVALGAQFGMSDIVALHSLSSCYLTNLCHSYTYLLIINELNKLEESLPTDFPRVG